MTVSRKQLRDFLKAFPEWALILDKPSEVIQYLHKHPILRLSDWELVPGYYRRQNVRDKLRSDFLRPLTTMASGMESTPPKLPHRKWATFFVAGAPGTGKSHLVKCCAEHLGFKADAESDSTHEMKRRVFDIYDVSHKTSAEVRRRLDDAEQLARSGCIVLLCLDEVHKAWALKDFADLMHTFCDKCKDNVTLILALVTSYGAGDQTAFPKYLKRIGVPGDLASRLANNPVSLPRDNYEDDLATMCSYALAAMHEAGRDAVLSVEMRALAYLLVVRPYSSKRAHNYFSNQVEALLGRTEDQPTLTLSHLRPIDAEEEPMFEQFENSSTANSFGERCIEISDGTSGR